MAHGLEIRSPLLDPRLAEFCFSMPASLRTRRGVTKYALRRAVRGWLPPGIIGRAKQGFMFPVGYWLSGAVLRGLVSMLRRGRLVEEGWIEAAGLERLADEHARGRADHHVRLWMLLSLETWHRLFLRGDRLDQVEDEQRGAFSMAIA